MNGSRKKIALRSSEMGISAVIEISLHPSSACRPYTYIDLCIEALLKSEGARACMCVRERERERGQ
jgi:hypothetical protein